MVGVGVCLCQSLLPSSARLLRTVLPGSCGWKVGSRAALALLNYGGSVQEGTDYLQNTTPYKYHLEMPVGTFFFQ